MATGTQGTGETTARDVVTSGQSSFDTRAGQHSVTKEDQHKAEVFKARRVAQNHPAETT